MAAQVAVTACRKLVKDMHYEACVQTVITYCADVEKKEGRQGHSKEYVPHAGTILEAK